MFYVNIATKLSKTGLLRTLSVGDNEVDQEAGMSEFHLEKDNADDSKSNRHNASNYR